MVALRRRSWRAPLSSHGRLRQYVTRLDHALSGHRFSYWFVDSEDPLEVLKLSRPCPGAVRSCSCGAVELVLEA